MKPRILVAGATGALGRHVVEALHRQGCPLRLLSRSAERVAALASSDDQVHVGDATNREEIASSCEGVDLVFSCLGQSVGADPTLRSPGYYDIDYRANANLIEVAKSAGVQRFVYVSVFAAERYPQVAYLRAHADVAELLRGSGLSYAIVQPTGYFSAYGEFLGLARRNQSVIIGNGQARTNPIHDADLAQACVEALFDQSKQEYPVGGPDVFTRQEVVELAHQVLGTPVVARRVPPWMVRGAAGLIRFSAPRLGELAQFLECVSTHDFVAPAYGTSRLVDYFRETHR
ncbi:MAG: SDR family oxidoreductase [Roseiflexaceae bacterium]